MLVKNIFNVIDRSEVSKVIVTPVYNAVLGVRPSPGRWVSIDVNDSEALASIGELEVEKLAVMNDMLKITV